MPALNQDQFLELCSGKYSTDEERKTYGPLKRFRSYLEAFASLNEQHQAAWTQKALAAPPEVDAAKATLDEVTARLGRALAVLGKLEEAKPESRAIATPKPLAKKISEAKAKLERLALAPQAEDEDPDDPAPAGSSSPLGVLQSLADAASARMELAMVIAEAAREVALAHVAAGQAELVELEEARAEARHLNQAQALASAKLQALQAYHGEVARAEAQATLDAGHVQILREALA